jgi:GxxExxY protein
LEKAGLPAVAQTPVPVSYDGITAGNFVADIIVEDTVIIELKSVKQIIQVHEVQLVNYLVATGKDVGLILNFGESNVEVKRKRKTPPQP